MWPTYAYISFDQPAVFWYSSLEWHTNVYEEQRPTTKRLQTFTKWKLFFFRELQTTNLQKKLLSHPPTVIVTDTLAMIIPDMVPGNPQKFGIPPKILTIGFWSCEIPLM